MNFSIVIPYRPSDEYRHRNLEFCYARWRAWYPNAEIILSDWRRKGNADLSSGNDRGDFNRSASRNLGVEQAKNDIIVFADADTIAGEKLFVDIALGSLEKGSLWVLPYSRYYNANEEWSAGLVETQDCEYLPEEDDIQYDHCLTDSISGIFVLKKESWETIHGEDSRFQAWGYEDRARQLALDTLIGPHERIFNGFVVHLWHPAPDENCFGQPNIEWNKSLYQRYLWAGGNKEEMRRLCDEHS